MSHTAARTYAGRCEACGAIEAHAGTGPGRRILCDCRGPVRLLQPIGDARDLVVVVAREINRRGTVIGNIANLRVALRELDQQEAARG